MTREEYMARVQLVLAFAILLGAALGVGGTFYIQWLGDIAEGQSKCDD